MLLFVDLCQTDSKHNRRKRKWIIEVYLHLSQRENPLVTTAVKDIMAMITSFVYHLNRRPKTNLMYVDVWILSVDLKVNHFDEFVLLIVEAVFHLQLISLLINMLVVVDLKVLFHVVLADSVLPKRKTNEYFKYFRKKEKMILQFVCWNYEYE